MRARTALTLTLLVALALCLLLFLPSRGGDAPTDLRRDAASEEVPDLRTERSPGETEHEAATLKGRPAPEQGDRLPRGVRVIVRSKAGIRVPGAGVVATWDGADGTPHALEEETTSDGSVFLPDVPRDGSARIAVRASARDEPATATDEVRVTADALVVTVDRGLPLHVRCVDDLTGGELPDAVVRGIVPRQVEGEGLPSGDQWVLALAAPNEKKTVSFRVDAPPGFVCWEHAGELASVGAWTRELEYVYPLRREADVRVSVLTHEGLPALDASIDSFHIAGRKRSGRLAERVGPGTFRLRGVPFFRHVHLIVTASAPAAGGQGFEAVQLGAHPSEGIELTITLPPPGMEQAVNNSVIGLGPGAGGAFGGRSPHAPTGSAVVEVRRHDGSPASGAKVRLDRRTVVTNADGLASFERLRVGEHKVVVHAIGLLPIQGVVRVEPGREARILLQEPAGGAVDVLVTDADGDPLPFASLGIRLPSKGA